jgi:hypothetical protein
MSHHQVVARLSFSAGLGNCLAQSSVSFKYIMQVGIDSTVSIFVNDKRA